MQSYNLWSFKTERKILNSWLLLIEYLCFSKSTDSFATAQNIFHSASAKYSIVLVFIQHTSGLVIVILHFTRKHGHLNFCQWLQVIFYHKMWLCDPEYTDLFWNKLFTHINIGIFHLSTTNFEIRKPWLFPKVVYLPLVYLFDFSFNFSFLNLKTQNTVMNDGMRVFC